MNLFIFDNINTLSEAAATLWTKKIWDKTDLRICLSAGKTPEPIYQKMIDFYHEGQVCMRDIEVFLLTEFGGIAPDAPECSQNMIRNSFLNWVDFPAGHLQCINPNVSNMDEEIKRYDDLFGTPMDLTILGIGVNGHIGMNEPGSMPDTPTRKVNLTQSSINAVQYYRENINTQDPLPTWAITVGMNRILESNEIWIVATGKYKAGVLRRLFAMPPSPETPASWLQNHPNCSIFADRQAASQLFTANN